MLKNVTGRDLIAAVLLAGAFALRALGVNTVTLYIIIAIGATYGLLHINGRGSGG